MVKKWGIQSTSLSRDALGSMENVVLYLNLANDPTIERIVTMAAYMTGGGSGVGCRLVKLSRARSRPYRRFGYRE